MVSVAVRSSESVISVNVGTYFASGLLARLSAHNEVVVDSKLAAGEDVF